MTWQQAIKECGRVLVRFEKTLPQAVMALYSLRNCSPYESK